MKPLKASTLHSLHPLLDVLRAHPALREVRPAEFALDDKDFVHFHEDSDGVFADVRLKEGRVHMPVSSPAQQGEFLERIDRTPGSPRTARVADPPYVQSWARTGKARSWPKSSC